MTLSNLKKDKYQLIIFATLAILIVLILLALIFGKINGNGSDNSTVGVVLTDGDLSINYVDGEEINSVGNNYEYKVTITNTGNSTLYFSMYLTDSNTENAKITVTDYDGNEINSVEGNISSEKLLNLQNIKAKETLRYIIVIDKMNLNLKANIKVINESTSTEGIYDLLLQKNDISVPKTVVGSEISTENEGLISTKDDKGDSYVFRGKNENNYLKLGDYLFRIVRINGDGSVRIVLNNTLEEKYPYNTNSTSQDILMENLALYKNTTLKNKLESWLNDNLKEYTNNIVDSSFCTEDKFTLDLNNIHYSNTYDRIYNNKTPSLECPGTITTSKIGLLSVDEVIYAGAYLNTKNTSYYLYNSEIKDSYLTISSYSYTGTEVLMMDIKNDGNLSTGISLNKEAYIRPVISINKDAKIKGEGTKTNPYVIVS